MFQKKSEIASMCFTGHPAWVACWRKVFLALRKSVIGSLWSSSAFFKALTTMAGLRVSTSSFFITPKASSAMEHDSLAAS